MKETQATESTESTEAAVTVDDLDEFTRAYLVCALWSSTDCSRDDGGDPLDDNYGIEDIDPKCLAGLVKECEDFREAEAEDLEECGGTDEQNGHDFWLTRNGHGTGFWDRGYGLVGERLTEACRPYGSVDLYVGDDGKIYAGGYES